MSSFPAIPIFRNGLVLDAYEITISCILKIVLPSSDVLLNTTYLGMGIHDDCYRYKNDDLDTLVSRVCSATAVIYSEIKQYVLYASQL